MIHRVRKRLVRFFIISDVAAIILSFAVAFWFRFHSGILHAPKGVPPFRQYLIIVPFLLLVQLLYFSYQESYKIKLRRNRLDDLFMVVLNCIVSSGVVLLLFSYLKSYRFVGFEISHLYLLVYALTATVIIYGARLLIFRLFRHIAAQQEGISRILIAGHGDLAEMTAENLAKYAHFGIEIVGYLSEQSGEKVLGRFDQLEKVARANAITDLFIALSLKEYDTIMRLIETGNNLLIDVHLVPDILQLASLKAGMEHIEGLPVIHLGDIPLQGWRAALKRTFDFVCSLLGLVVLFPLFLFLAIIIKLDSPGPVLYRQVRVGLDGSHFRVFKFRTMVHGAEKETGPIWSPPDDKRVTSLGRFLRKYSLDEILQLLNVLIGDMSLVGPRPERPEFVEKFKHSIPRYMLRHRVKAGITGWAQVHGLRGNTPLDKRIEFDIFYIQNWTLRMDLEILWRTIFKFKFIDKTN